MVNNPDLATRVGPRSTFRTVKGRETLSQTLFGNVVGPAAAESFQTTGGKLTTASEPL